jgi:hypothetical protein
MVKRLGQQGKQAVTCSKLLPANRFQRRQRGL